MDLAGRPEYWCSMILKLQILISKRIYDHGNITSSPCDFLCLSEAANMSSMTKYLSRRSIEYLKAILF